MTNVHPVAGARDRDGGGPALLPPACFARGTGIATPRGTVPVESLRPGDSVLSAFGGTRIVLWLGYRRVDCRRHPLPREVWPIRIRAGAFARGQPVRDLVLSPNHGVYMADATGGPGVLIPVRCLLNGSTVVQEAADTITYYHVELPHHDVILAEGLPTESYLDVGNRGAFENGGEPLQLHPAFTRRASDAESWEGVVVQGPAVAAARQRLLARESALGFATTGDPDLRLQIPGRLLRAACDGQTCRFALPGGTDAGWLVSRVFVPAERLADNDDRRLLGVAVTRLALGRRELDLAGPALGEGWHPPEPGRRWTTGCAAVALGGARTLIVSVAGAGPYLRPRRRTVTQATSP
ncbi:Hint domain-containing protein [Rhodovastum sp. RN2-1]|uniref:Hint domain-containing protein n=2 Tax=Limobrevibacterium gyesilva TaxID=2991712 RepID=A0AA42CIG0_9PROT|nr:Hint domain-containing protein [Limobrevibacterium gyesilva]MCW3475892.1 Hint domain-containing protein [Limobrevibacterium gyesilva]